MKKVEGGKSQANKLLVQQALQWVAFARRPLTVPELQEAVAFDIVDDHWDADKIPDGGRLIGLCRGLIIRDQDDRVRFAHHTVRQHLLRPAVQSGSHIKPFLVESDGLSSPDLIEYYFTDVRAEFQLAVNCAAYLCFSDFESAMVKADEQKAVTMRQVFRSGGPIAIPATIGLKRQLFQIPYRFLGGNGEIRMPEIDFSSYDRRFNQRARPELRDKYALLDYVAEYWPWHTKQRLSKTGIELHLPRDVCDEQTIDQFVIGKEIRVEMQIGCLPVFRKFWDLILHKNLSFEIRPWGPNQHHGTYGCQGCPPSESKDRLLQRSRWSSLVHWAAEMGHVSLIQALPAEMIMDHMYHERYHHQSLNVACAHDQSELISYMLTAVTREVGKLKAGSRDLTLRINQGPYVIADWIEFCCKSGALEGFIAMMDFGELFYYMEVAKGALLKGAFAAASSGRLHLLKRLLDSYNVDFRAEDAAKMTLLHMAARKGHADVVEEILWRGTQLLNLQNAQGETPLILASQGGHAKVVQHLLEAGATVLTCGGGLIDLPHEASVHILLQGLGTCEAIQYPTAVHFAAANGHRDVLLKLLGSEALQKEQKARGFSQFHSTLTTTDNGSLKALDPLECAVVYGHESCVSLLLPDFLHLNKCLQIERDGICSRALHLAATMGHEQVVRLLLQIRADPDTTIGTDITPLHLAAETGKTAIIVLLLDSVQSNGGESAQSDIYERLNRGLVSRFQQTPLELAIVNGHSEAVEKLIDYGADPQLECNVYRDLSGGRINALQLAIGSRMAGSAIMKAVCVRGIPRRVAGSSIEVSDQNLLALAIEHRSPEKLQTLFDLGLRDGSGMYETLERSYTDAPDLVRAAIFHRQYQCLDILFANCSYDYNSLLAATQLAKLHKSTVKGASERYSAERVLEMWKRSSRRCRQPDFRREDE